MRFSTLDEWLDWQLTLNTTEIQLGLERVGAVWRQLHPQPPQWLVITVAGTNGKGSSVTFLREIYTAAGYHVGCYTSPHLQRYNERILINDQQASDQALCEAFEAIDQARGDILLTYFEFGTLAALYLFSREPVDLVILEVGLGGRLDAVNIIDADIGLITSIDIDHQEWLGDDREQIAREKAGIARDGRPLVYAASDMPATVAQTALAVGARLYRAGDDFGLQSRDDAWDWWCCDGRSRNALPHPGMRGRFQLENAAAVLMVVELMQGVLPVNQQAIRSGLLSARLFGRFQLVARDPTVILDVAHNPEAARGLRENLKEMFCHGKSVALFSMLMDKNVEAVVTNLCDVIDLWCLVPLNTPRAMSLDQLGASLRRAGVTAERIETFMTADQALVAARRSAGKDGRVVAFGSFYLVSAVQQAL